MVGSRANDDAGPDNPFLATRPVYVDLEIGGRKHRIELRGNAAGPAFPQCTPNVASLGFFYAGMSLSFSIELVAPERAVLSSSESLGESASPESSDLYVFGVPRDVRIRQRIVVVRPDGPTEELCATP